MSEFNDYQVKAHSTAVYPPEWGITYPVMKLSGEAGEVAEKIGKMMRSGVLWIDEVGEVHDGMSQAQADELVKELGDVLWYVAEIATLLGVSLQAVALKNNDKLADRSIRNLLIGEGDNR